MRRQKLAGLTQTFFTFSERIKVYLFVCKCPPRKLLARGHSGKNKKRGKKHLLQLVITITMRLEFYSFVCRSPPGKLLVLGAFWEKQLLLLYWKPPWKVFLRKEISLPFILSIPASMFSFSVSFYFYSLRVFLPWTCRMLSPYSLVFCRVH